MINLLKDGPLWRSFGITIEKGQGYEWFIFDKEKGLGMADNIAVVVHAGDTHVQIYGQIKGVDYNAKVPIPEKLEADIEYGLAGYDKMFKESELFPTKKALVDNLYSEEE